MGGVADDRPGRACYPKRMALQTSFTRWRDRARAWTQAWDRARSGTFFRFLLKRFLDDRLLEAAGALSFTTAFAIVPLSMVVFGVLSAFPVYEEWSRQLSAYIFSNFVPSSARAVESYLLDFSSNAGKLTAVEASAAKLWHSETAWAIIDASLQLHGGAGYMNEYPIARLWRDARVARIYGGTSEIMKELIGRSIAPS